MKDGNNGSEESKNLEIRALMRDVIQEFMRSEQTRSEPAYKAELVEERRRRESLERRVNELVEENRRSRLVAEEAERSATIRAELQRLGVAKVDLAYRAVREEIQRAEDGRLVGRTGSGEVTLRDYLSQFVADNPELLPARVAGGSGAGPIPRAPQTPATPPVDLHQIRPGMSLEDLERVRREITRVAAETLRGV